MSAWRSWIWERNEVYRDVTNHSLLVKYVTYAFAYGHHVHVGQRLLRKEAPGIDVSSGSETIHRTDYLDLTIWLNQEGDAGTGHLMAHACWSSFNDSTHSAERGHVLCPALEEQWHRNDRFLREIFS